MFLVSDIGSTMTVAGMWKLAIMSSIVPLNVDGRKNTPRKKEINRNLKHRTL
jgi:hypothetical protein